MYKNCQIITIHTSIKKQTGKYLILNKLKQLCIWDTNKSGVQNSLAIPHLYIVSDDEIKEGDFCEDNGLIYQIKDKNHLLTVINFGDAKKIIATTDNSLNIENKCWCMKPESGGCSQCLMCLPQLPESFIEKYIENYNNHNQIKEVMVEYEEAEEYDKVYGHGNKFPRLLINSDNTINIKSIKDSWHREEVIKLMEKSIDRGIQLNKDYKIIHKKVHIDKWIEENL